MLGNAVLYSFTDESAAVRPAECTASLPLTAQNRCRERRHCAGRVRPRARGAALETSSNWTIAKVYPKEFSRFVSLYILWKKAAKRVWKLLNIVLKLHLCVWDAGADGSGWWILWISYFVSSRSTSSTASVSELSCLVTHTAVSSPQCNTEKRPPPPPSNSVTFRTLFKWHRYCGILKIHIIRKINTGIRYEPVYRPALILVCFSSVLVCKLKFCNAMWSLQKHYCHYRKCAVTTETWDVFQK